GTGGIRRPRLGEGRPNGNGVDGPPGTWTAGGGMACGGIGVPDGVKARGAGCAGPGTGWSPWFGSWPPTRGWAGTGGGPGPAGRAGARGRGPRRVAQPDVDHAVGTRDHYRVGRDRLHGTAGDRVADPVTGDALGQRILQIRDRRAFAKDHAVQVGLGHELR